MPDDLLQHAWQIVPAGERRVLTKTSWGDGERKLAMELDHGYRGDDQPRVVLERGFDDAIAAAFDAMEPERLTSTLALIDSLDAATLAPASGFAQLHGVLAIRHRLGRTAVVLEIPLRFALGGNVTAPESIARLARAPSAAAVAPARALIVR